MPIMSNAQITTYEYEPLKGITRAIAPNGRNIYYEYDDYGRLIKTSDDKGNPINKYEYNYRKPL